MCGFKKIPGFDGYVSDCTKGESLFKGDLGPECQVYPTCDHIIGYETCLYECWIIRVSDKEVPGDPFNYCPLCGEKLKED